MGTALRRIALAGVLGVVLGGILAAGSAVAEGDVQAAARRARLKERTRAWLVARQSLYFRMDRRVRVSRKNFMLLHYDLQSPAWRARQGGPETLDDTFRAMDEGKGRPRAVTRFAVLDVELVGERFGVGRYRMNGLDAIREVRWVWAEDQGARRSDWYLYGGDVDGPWGESACDPSPSVRKELPKADADAVAALLGKLELAHTVRTIAGAGETDVVVVLAWEGAHSEKDRTLATRTDAIAVTRALLGGDTRWSGVRLAFLADWMDRFGAVKVRPHLHACMDRGTLEKIVFENLTPEQVFALFRTRALEHEGLTLRTH